MRDTSVGDLTLLIVKYPLLGSEVFATNLPMIFARNRRISSSLMCSSLGILPSKSRALVTFRRCSGYLTYGRVGQPELRIRRLGGAVSLLHPGNLLPAGIPLLLSLVHIGKHLVASPGRFGTRLFVADAQVQPQLLGEFSRHVQRGHGILPNLDLVIDIAALAYLPPPRET